MSVEKRSEISQCMYTRKLHLVWLSLDESTTDVSGSSEVDSLRPLLYCLKLW